MCESHVSSGAQQPLLQQLAAQGQTVFVAAGDSGSSSCAYNAQPGVTGVEYGNVVDDPSNSPWVTAIGGLTVTSINPLSQSVWGGTCSGGAPCGGGGGSSNAYGRPSWQVGPGVVLTNHRQVPDISVMGDPRTGMLAYFSGRWHGFGGTSIGAPILGAMMAVGAQACGLQNLGFINPRLYQMAINGTGIIDVTTGSNDLYNTGNYSADSGFDMASGLGSPDPSTFLPTLCGQAQSFATSSAGVGAAATWTFNYFSSGAALTSGAGSITLHGFINGGFSSSASDYTINGTHPSAVSVTGSNATLTVGATVNALSAVTLVASNATNATVVGKASIEVTDSNGYSATFQTAYVASTVGSVAVAGASTAGAGTSGASISVTVRNASSATLAGVPVTVNVPSGTYAVPTSNGLTNVHGVATFRVVAGTTGSRSITATAGGTTSSAIAINFTNPWRNTTKSFTSKAGALTGQLVASTNCGTVGRSSTGALYSSITAVNATLTSSNGAALLPTAASDPDAADGTGSTCLISYVGKDGKVRLVSIASGQATATILNTSSNDKAATASPGIAVVGSTIYVANLSSSGYLMVTSTDGTTTTRDNISTSNGIAKATGAGYALAQSVAVANGVPSIALRVSKNIYVFTYNSTYSNWAPTNIADLARWSISGSSAFTGNPTLVGGTALAMYARTTGQHLVEVTPDLENIGFWNTNDITTSFSSLKAKSDAVVFGSSARQLAVLVGTSVTVLSSNGPSSQPWIPVTVTFTGAKSVFSYAIGSLGAFSGSKLATFSS
jgi:subtilase family serine protease